MKPLLSLKLEIGRPMMQGTGRIVAQKEHVNTATFMLAAAGHSLPFLQADGGIGGAILISFIIAIFTGK